MASPVVSSWPYSPTSSSTNLGNHANPRSPRLKNSHSNNLAVSDSNSMSSLHNTLNSLSLSGGNGDFALPASSSEEGGNGSNGFSQQQQQRPGMPIRTPSATSIQRSVAAIGSGRSGTSPPSRANMGSSESSGNSLWPSSSNPSSSNNAGHAGSQQDSRAHGYHSYHATQNIQNAHHPENPHHHELGNGSGGKGGHSGADESSSRYALSQPQFNLDHAQLAKSREQRDLDDVDSGQRASATLWMGDLEGWMDESYIRRCISALGWDRDENGNQTIQTNVKMIKGASSTSGYCFITFPTSAHVQSVLSHFSKQPPMLMPGSERTFKLNWATGLPGVQPKWEGEYSVFVGDLGREVSEGELVALFTPLFPSTKSAKIMYDPSTGLSRGYGFVRFGDENDMQRSLALGQNTSGSGLSLRGRTLRISEASGSGGNRNRTFSNETASASLLDSTNGMPNGQKNPRDLHIQVPGSGGNIGGGGGGGGDPKSPYGNSSFMDHRHSSSGNSPNLLSPNATGFSIPVASPTSPTTPSYMSSPLSPSADPNNTTVFVGGLPACINEETLKSFFQHFGEITYVKIPPNKGCGFVQFVRRADAELAIAKMHDFPIHGKSRIRLSWGRSQGDKQVEHVRKLANALNVPFEAVWRMVQGQDNTTIKQIASAVGGGSGVRGGRPDAEAARADLVRLTGFVDANGGLSGPPAGSDLAGQQRGIIYDGIPTVGPSPYGHLHSSGPGIAPIPGPHDPETYTFRPVVPQSLRPEQFGWAGPPRDSGPYSRVSPSSFAPMSTSNLGGHPQTTVPLSPSASVGPYTHHAIGNVASAYTPYTPLPMSSQSSLNGGLSPTVAETAGATFEPRQWRQANRGMEQVNGGQSNGIHELLGGSTNGRATAGFDGAF